MSRADRERTRNLRRARNLLTDRLFDLYHACAFAVQGRDDGPPVDLAWRAYLRARIRLQEAQAA